MKLRFMTKRAIAGAVGAAAMLLAGAAQAALEDRDLDGDTVVDAFYDTDLDITWLRDANVNGLMDWHTAVSWAGGFSLGAYSDWRLPTSDTCSGYNCTDSEMGHLWYGELGNTVGGPVNTGGFYNLETTLWSGTEYAPPPANYAWFFEGNSGYQDAYERSVQLHAIAVRDGDVAAVPEPETYALMLAGLAALAIARRQRRR